MNHHSFLKTRLCVALVLALLLVSVFAGAAFAQGGVTVERARALLVELSATINQNLTVGADVTVGDDLAVADDANITGDAAVTGAAAVTGNSTFGGTMTVTGVITSTSDLILSADATGGNAGAKTELIGLPRIKLVATGTATNGSTETTSYTDDSSAGEYAPIDADVTEAEGSTDSIARIGSSSYKATFAATASANDGFKRTITGDDLEANESIGFWIYSSTALAAADLQILLTDDGGARNFDVPAVATANRWTWVEVDISALTGGTGDAVTEFGITLTTQGATALGAFTIYIDGAFKWDADDEEALGNAIVQDGVLSVATIATAAGTANTPAVPVENTDFFVHYEATNDFIVWMTNQSANSAVVLIAY